MLPEAIACKEAYAILWRHFVAIEHALKKSLEVENSSQLSELDKERLEKLIDFLQQSIDEEYQCKSPFFHAMIPYDIEDSSLFIIQDALDRFKEVKEFKEYSTQSPKKKVEKFIHTLTDFLNNPELIAKKSRENEIRVLRSIMDQFILETEASFDPMPHM